MKAIDIRPVTSMVMPRPLSPGGTCAERSLYRIAATETMLQAGKGTIWSNQIGDYLWTLGKEPGFRQVERHATLDTCFY